MSTDNLDEYRAKLQKSKQQLKKVKQLLTQQPHNENLMSLKKDLVEVITVTENLILKKQEKSFDPSKAIKQNRNQKQSRNHPNEYPHNHDSKPSMQQTPYNSMTASNPNIYANNPMFVQNNVAFKDEKQKKQIPREWGIKKEHYEIGERCQVKWQRRWYIAKVLSQVITTASINHNPKEEKDGDKEEEELIKYRVWFLNHGQEYTASLNHIRSYVPPLPSQLSIGLKIKAIWSKDDRFYPAIIQEIGEDGQYKIKFEKYNEYSSVVLYDIQLMNKKDALRADGINSSLVKKDQKTGTLLIEDKAAIPQSLWSRDDDTPVEREKKRKKIRSIKKQHRSLKLDVESKNRANDWLRFKSKSRKKSKKKFQSTLLRNEKTKSIFESTSGVNASMIDSNANMTHFKQRTHFHHLKKDPKHYKNNNDHQ